MDGSDAAALARRGQGTTPGNQADHPGQRSADRSLLLHLAVTVPNTCFPAAGRLLQSSWLGSW